MEAPKEEPEENQVVVDDQVPLTETNQPRILPAVVVVTISGIAPIIFGFVFGFSSPSAPELEEENLLTKDQASWYSSLALLGTILGSFIGSFIVDALGRKTVLMLLSVPSSVGWGMIVLCLQAGWTGSTLLGVLYTGRALTGVAAGLIICTYPVYIAETAPKNIRGVLGASTMVLIHTGILIVYALGIPLHSKWLAVVPVVLSLLLGFLMFFLPESPSWLLKNQRRDKAIEAVKWLRGSAYNIEVEIHDTEDFLESQGAQAFQVNNFGHRSVYKPFLLGLVLAIIQLAGGINVVIFYNKQVVEDAGFKSNPGVISVVTAVVLLVSDLPPGLLVDRAGRRVFLLLSSSLMTLCLIVLGTVFYLIEELKKDNLNALALVVFAVFLISFGLGIGPVVMIVVGEIFPLRGRGALLGVVVIIAYIATFIEVKEFYAMKDAMQSYGTFWFFAGINLLGLLFIAVFIPETKGKSLEEIENYFSDSTFV